MLGPKYVGSKKMVGLKTIFGARKFWVKKKFWVVKELYGPKKFGVPAMDLQKNCRSKINLGSKRMLGLKNCLDPKKKGYVQESPGSTKLLNKSCGYKVFWASRKF